jgi:hypothetical protein
MQKNEEQSRHSNRGKVNEVFIVLQEHQIGEAG